MSVPLPYNLSTMANSTGFVDLMQTVNTSLMQGYFGTLLLVAVYVILLMAFMKATKNIAKALAPASFIAFILSLFLRIMDLIPDGVMYGILAIAAISVAFIGTRD